MHVLIPLESVPCLKICISFISTQFNPLYPSTFMHTCLCTDFLGGRRYIIGGQTVNLVHNNVWPLTGCLSLYYVDPRSHGRHAMLPCWSLHTQPPPRSVRATAIVKAYCRCVHVSIQILMCIQSTPVTNIIVTSCEFNNCTRALQKSSHRCMVFVCLCSNGYAIPYLCSCKHAILQLKLYKFQLATGIVKQIKKTL